MFHAVPLVVDWKTFRFDAVPEIATDNPAAILRVFPAKTWTVWGGVSTIIALKVVVPVVFPIINVPVPAPVSCKL